VFEIIRIRFEAINMTIGPRNVRKERSIEADVRSNIKND